MTSFPVDAPQERVIKALVRLGFVEYSKKEHIKMVRNNADGTSTKLALPNHRTIKGSTLRTICTQIGVSREAFLQAYEKS